MKKKNLILVGTIILLAIITAGCSAEKEAFIDDTAFQMRKYANSNCKRSDNLLETDALNADDKEYIEYEATSDGYLAVKHVNTIFNCAPGKLSMTASAKGNEIKILEKEQEGLADCTCPYDMQCEVGPLAEGAYVIKLYKHTLDKEAYATLKVLYKAGVKGKIMLSEP